MMGKNNSGKRNIHSNTPDSSDSFLADFLVSSDMPDPKGEFLIHSESLIRPDDQKNTKNDYAPKPISDTAAPFDEYIVGTQDDSGDSFLADFLVSSDSPDPKGEFLIHSESLIMRSDDQSTTKTDDGSELIKNAADTLDASIVHTRDDSGDSFLADFLVSSDSPDPKGEFLIHSKSMIMLPDDQISPSNYDKPELITDKSYTVEHYLEELSNTGFALAASDTLTGTSGETVRAEAKTYLGFICDPNAVRTAASGTLFADDSLVLKLFYTRNRHTVSFNTDADTEGPEDQRVHYGGLVNRPTDPVKKGYVFDRWNNLSIPWNFDKDTMPDKDLSLTASWTAATGSAYTVEHYQENLDNSGFTLVASANLTGTTGETVTAAAKMYTGFTFDSNAVRTVASGSILADGSLVLKLYYMRNCHTVAFDANADTEGPDDQTANYSALVSKPSDPEKEGYVFGGWQNGTAPWDFNRDTMPDGDLVLTASWMAATGTAYTFEHYQENLNGDGYVLADTDHLSGTTGVAVNATAKTYTGFTYDPDAAGSIASGTLLADGSLVLKLYYSRNSNKVAFDANADTFALEDQRVPYSSLIRKPSDPKKEGYDLAGWYDGERLWDFATHIMPDRDLTLTATWMAAKNTAYTVEHYQENLDSTGFTLAASDNLTGTTGETVYAAAKTYTGFTIDPNAVHTPASGTLLADGSLVLKLYYIRNYHTVAFDANVDTAGPEDQRVRYAALVRRPSDPEKEGYVFNGWQNGNAPWNFHEDAMPDGDLTLTACWISATGTAYALEHYLENLNGDSYELAAVDHLTGITGEAVNATSKTYTGFTYDSNAIHTAESGSILADGSLVLKLFYARNSHWVTFVANADSSDPADQSVNYGALASEPSAPAKEGYVFDGWLVGERLWDFDADIMPDGDLTLTASWTAAADTAYVVEHYQENLNGDSYELADVDHLIGITGESVNATAKTYTGFTYDPNAVCNTEGGSILADGSLVMKMYYTRNIRTVGFVADSDTAGPEDQSIKYGALASQPSIPEKKGYLFGGWLDGERLWDFNADIMPDEDLILTASWKAATGTVYTVGHYQENLNGDAYELADTENLTGATNETVNVAAKSYTGFTYDPDVAGSAASGTVLPDGSLVLKLFYARNSHWVTFVANADSSDPADQSVNFGALASEPSAPAKEGYVFDGWLDGERFWDFNAHTMLDGDLTLTASWKAATGMAYIVGHYQENLNGDGYELADTENLTGTTNETVNVAAKSYTGFTYDPDAAGSAASGTVLPDGSLVLKLFYARNSHWVTFVANADSSDPADQSVNYGALASEPSSPAKEGYVFEGWQNGAALWDFNKDVMPDEDLVLTASWISASGTIYTLEHYQENLNCDSYERIDVDHLTGTTGETVTAEAKTYTGFTYDPSAVRTSESGTILADGTLVLRLYYARNSHTVAFNANIATPRPEDQRLRYSALVRKPSEPVKEGYVFAGWYEGERLWDFDTDIMPDEDLTLNASWMAATDTAYTVEHYQEDLTNTGFTLIASDNMSGTTGETVTAAAKSYTGFTYDPNAVSSESSGSILADGTLVLRLYYTRNSHTVAFDADADTSAPKDQRVYYSALVIKPSDPEKKGCVFDGWRDGERLWDFVSDSMPDGDLNLTASWMAAMDTLNEPDTDTEVPEAAQNPLNESTVDPEVIAETPDALDKSASHGEIASNTPDPFNDTDNKIPPLSRIAIQFNVAGITQKNDEGESIQDSIRNVLVLPQINNSNPAYGGFTRKEAFDRLMAGEEVLEARGISGCNDISLIKGMANTPDANTIKVVHDDVGHLGYVPSGDMDQVDSFLEKNPEYDLEWKLYGGKCKEIDHERNKLKICKRNYGLEITLYEQY